MRNTICGDNWHVIERVDPSIKIINQIFRTFLYADDPMQIQEAFVVITHLIGKADRSYIYMVLAIFFYE